ncbi:muts domain V-domain-containing protein [Kockovaella imperatae]|uniref:DNA mismatch repair protein MSH3 n=1 Tax=Kockovaella imperatae TaxID=4999 RepID=A0A1Y1U6N8_9TREE|nr:muts domain V-domain-containing protein [Kockovaella imperatae]ORX33699.1 muts domain V-domain-containing protein [Kockovaella imperatae]
MTPKKRGEDDSQPAISSFFKRKSPPSTRISVIEVQDNTPIIIDDDEPDGVVEEAKLPTSKRLKLSGESCDGQAMTTTTSSYFGTSASSSRKTSRLPSDEGVTSDRPASSRTKSTLLSDYALPKSLQVISTPSGSAFPTFATGSVPYSGESKRRTEEQQKRHEAWQRRMAEPGGIIPRRRSLALDEAAAAEARKMLMDGDDAGERTGQDTPGLDLLDASEEDTRTAENAERVGNHLMARFGVNEKSKTGRVKKKEEEVGPSGQTYTPLEKQFMEIKGENPDVLLFMEVGYKYKFHGDDAKTASKELGIACFPSRNFYTASVPVHRLHVHVKKLISLGYKVGVISQLETAALKKVGDNRNAPFTRKLTHLFTAATYVEDPSLGSSSNIIDDPVLPGSAPPPTNALVAIVEKGMGGQAVDERVRIAVVSVVPSTGEVVWDEFDDSQVRTELETRLTHLQPAELLLPKIGLSAATEKVLTHFSGHSKASSASIRVERFPDVPKYGKAFNDLTKFYHSQTRAGETVDLTKDDVDMNGSEGEDDLEATAHAGDVDMNDGGTILELVDFPKQVVIALHLAVQHMKTFGLENAFRHRTSFVKFINRAHMLLSSNTLINLEIYRNQTDGSIHGSLLWLLDHTKTRMGRRLMREWLGRPLLDVSALQARVDAIEEIMGNKTYYMEKLRSLLVNMPDLIKGLTRIQYGKATPNELATILVGLHRIASEYKATVKGIFKSKLLNNILEMLPTIKDTTKRFLDAIDIKAARNDDKSGLWADPDRYPDIQDAKDCISICEAELKEHLHQVRKVLHRPSLNYVTVAGIEYLVEVPTRDAKTVPAKWVKISATKTAVRFHTPEVLNIIKEREQHRETLAAVSKQAFLDFQADISECHSLLVVARQIAIVDCLISLAQVAAASGYCKPTFVAEPSLHINQGRHPMVEMLRDEAYVPFDIHFSERDGRAKVITGPNMAGKSSCVRATALIVCMAQIGSFVPAASVTLGIHDTVQTRMGAADEIERGKSTFMVELSETSDILRTITPRSLVILDELGRGTSTYDGVAIAYATLSHIAQVGCNTLFVTHYPAAAEELASEMPKRISNWHMSFEETKMPDGSKEITFLYQLKSGLAEASFGVWCARLAGLSNSVLQTAQLRADQMKAETAQKTLSAIVSRTRSLFSSLSPSGHDSLSSAQVVDALALQKALRFVPNL